MKGCEKLKKTRSKLYNWASKENQVHSPHQQTDKVIGQSAEGHKSHGGETHQQRQSSTKEVSKRNMSKIKSPSLKAEKRMTNDERDHSSLNNRSTSNGDMGTPSSQRTTSGAKMSLYSTSKDGTSCDTLSTSKTKSSTSGASNLSTSNANQNTSNSSRGTSLPKSSTSNSSTESSTNPMSSSFSRSTKTAKLSSTYASAKIGTAGAKTGTTNAKTCGNKIKTPGAVTKPTCNVSQRKDVRKNTNTKPGSPYTKRSSPNTKPSSANTKPSSPNSKLSSPNSKPTTSVAKPGNLDANFDTFDSKPSNLNIKPSTPVAKPSNSGCTPVTSSTKPKNPSDTQSASNSIQSASITIPDSSGCKKISALDSNPPTFKSKTMAFDPNLKTETNMSDARCVLTCLRKNNDDANMDRHDTLQSPISAKLADTNYEMGRKSQSNDDISKRDQDISSSDTEKTKSDPMASCNNNKKMIIVGSESESHEDTTVLSKTCIEQIETFYKSSTSSDDNNNTEILGQKVTNETTEVPQLPDVRPEQESHQKQSSLATDMLKGGELLTGNHDDVSQDNKMMNKLELCNQVHTEVTSEMPVIEMNSQTVTLVAETEICNKTVMAEIAETSTSCSSQVVAEIDMPKTTELNNVQFNQNDTDRVFVQNFSLEEIHKTSETEISTDDLEKEGHMSRVVEHVSTDEILQIVGDAKRNIEVGGQQEEKPLDDMCEPNSLTDVAGVVYVEDKLTESLEVACCVTIAAETNTEADEGGDMEDRSLIPLDGGEPDMKEFHDQGKLYSELL